MKRPSPALCALSLSIVLAAPFARAQDIPLPNVVMSEAKDADVKLPDFDVASVKPNKGDGNMMRWMYTPDGMSTTNLSLKNLIASAYNIKQYLISGGPSWVSSTGFDVDAKVAGPDVETFKKISPSQRRLMLQKLLAERFNLAVHTETKTLPVYDLVLATGGPKFKPAAPDPSPSPDANPSDPPKMKSMLRMGHGTLNLQDMPLSALVSQLGYTVSRDVIDKTGLAGKYDIDLKWTPDDSPANAGSEAGKSDQDQAPNIFTAIQEQLGLKLESAKAPEEFFVIDHVERPSEN